VNKAFTSLLQAAGLFLLPMLVATAACAETLRFIPQADLRSLDPIWTTAYITRNHGYMVYDTLFATDDAFQPQPQMIDHWSVSPDQLTYTFTLRDGLKFHDGEPVRPADCIASLTRWGKRDVLGQKLLEMIAAMMPADERSFTISLTRPFPLLIESLAKLSSNVPFIMPERIALTDPFTQITDPVGSGPFKFVKEEWVPGSKVVYVRNPDYVPRKEPPSWAAGGKVAKVDRIEWTYIPDPATAAAALVAGEADWWEFFPQDLVSVLQQSPDVTVATIDPIGSQGVIRFNHLQPPFDNIKLRQAVLAAVNQEDFMRAVAGDEKGWKTCYSVYSCGTPLATEAGADMLKAHDLEKARNLVKESGYKGERIAVMSATDQPIVNVHALVAMDLLQKLGLNAELQASDWGTLITRRASREPVDKGGWSLFFTWFVGSDMVSPAVNAPLRSAGEKSWFGWPTNPRIETLRNAWFEASDPDTQRKIASDIQEEAFSSVPYIPTGQFSQPTAYRNSLTGVIVAPVTFLWNVEKK